MNLDRGAGAIRNNTFCEEFWASRMGFDTVFFAPRRLLGSGELRRLQSAWMRILDRSRLRRRRMGGVGHGWPSFGEGILATPLQMAALAGSEARKRNGTLYWFAASAYAGRSGGRSSRKQEVT